MTILENMFCFISSSIRGADLFCVNKWTQQETEAQCL